MRPPISGESSDLQVGLHNELRVDIDRGLGSIRFSPTSPANAPSFWSPLVERGRWWNHSSVTSISYRMAGPASTATFWWPAGGHGHQPHDRTRRHRVDRSPRGDQPASLADNRGGMRGPRCVRVDRGPLVASQERPRCVVPRGQRSASRVDLAASPSLVGRHHRGSHVAVP
jgi:hypothetical protein